MAPADKPLSRGRTLVYRTPLVIRLVHWINAGALAILLMSGLQIFNAHPALYWGETSDFDNPLLEIGHASRPDNTPYGFLAIGSWEIETTGFLGLSYKDENRLDRHAFPSWAVLPGYQDLGQGRRWHFFFAWLLVINGAIYVLWNVLSGRLGRALLPTLTQLRGIGRSILDHLRLRHPKGEEARHYNVLQKIAYLVVMFGLLPLMVATGLAMSPTFNAIAPWLLDVLGGRQSARTLHFIAAAALVLFFVIHILEVILAGPINEMRSIITGWFVIKPAKPKIEAEA